MRRTSVMTVVLAMAMTLLAGTGAQAETSSQRLFLRHPDTGASCASARFLSRTPATDDLECGWSRNTSTVNEAYTFSEGTLVLDPNQDITGTLVLGSHSQLPAYGEYTLSVTIRAATEEDPFLVVGSSEPMEVRAVSVVAPTVTYSWTVDIPEEFAGQELTSLTFEFTQADSIQVNHGYVRKDRRESFLDVPVVSAPVVAS